MVFEMMVAVEIDRRQEARRHAVVMRQVVAISNRKSSAVKKDG